MALSDKASSCGRAGVASWNKLPSSVLGSGRGGRASAVAAHEHPSRRRSNVMRGAPGAPARRTRAWRARFARR